MKRIDAHTHLVENQPETLYRRAMESGVDAFCVLGIPAMLGAANNFECMLLKQRYPKQVYAFGGLVWKGTFCKEPREQLDRLLQAGFDGLKIIESKPNLQRALQFDPQDPHFEPMFALACKEGIPILWHVGDPAPFWRLDTAPDFAVQNGWTYEEDGFLSLDALYGQTETVLQRHPGLRVILAHFYFCSDRANHLEKLLAQYPNLSVDITPGVEMYHAFARDPGFWQQFFEKHAGRILMGSDMTDEAADQTYQPLGRIIRGMLQPAHFTQWDIATHGFSLSPQALQLIWAGNFESLCPGGPKELKQAGLASLYSLYREHLGEDAVALAHARLKELTR